MKIAQALQFAQEVAISDESVHEPFVRGHLEQVVHEPERQALFVASTHLGSLSVRAYKPHAADAAPRHTKHGSSLS